MKEEEEEMKEEEIRMKAKAWGARLNVPSRVIAHLRVAVGDEIICRLTEQEGKPIAVLRKEEKE